MENRYFDGNPFVYWPEPYPVFRSNDFGYHLDADGVGRGWILNPAAVLTSLRFGRHEADLMTTPDGNPASCGIKSQRVVNDGDHVEWTIETKGFEGRNRFGLKYDADPYTSGAVEMLVAIYSGCDWDRFRFSPFEFMHLTHWEFGAEITCVFADRADLVRLWNWHVGMYNTVMNTVKAVRFDGLLREFGHVLCERKEERKRRESWC